MLTIYPYTALITFLAVVLVHFHAFKVGGARRKYGVEAPATSGQPDFERVFRVHYNALENFILFVPTLWLFAASWGDLWAAGLGAIWVVGRGVYAAGYYKSPEARGPGFMISMIAFWLLLLGVLAGLARIFLGL